MTKPFFELPLRIGIAVKSGNVSLCEANGNIIGELFNYEQAQCILLAVNSFGPLVEIAKHHQMNLYELWERGAITDTGTERLDAVNAVLEPINKP